MPVFSNSNQQLITMFVIAASFGICIKPIARILSRKMTWGWNDINVPLRFFFLVHPPAVGLFYVLSYSYVAGLGLDNTTALAVNWSSKLLVYPQRIIVLLVVFTRCMCFQSTVIGSKLRYWMNYSVIALWAAFYSTRCAYIIANYDTTLTKAQFDYNVSIQNMMNIASEIVWTSWFAIIECLFFYFYLSFINADNFSILWGNGKINDYARLKVILFGVEIVIALLCFCEEMGAFVDFSIKPIGNLRWIAYSLAMMDVLEFGHELKDLVGTGEHQTVGQSSQVKSVAPTKTVIAERN